MELTGELFRSGRRKHTHAFEAVKNGEAEILALRCRECATSFPAARCCWCGKTFARTHPHMKACRRNCWDRWYYQEGKRLTGLSPQALRKRVRRGQRIASGELVPTDKRRCSYCHETGHYKSTCLEREDT